MSNLIFETSIGGLNLRSVGSLLVVGAAPLAISTLIAYRLSGGTLHRGFLVLSALICFTLLAGGVWQMAAPRVSLRSGSLDVGGGIYGISAPLRELDVDCARLTGRGELKRILGRRTNGIELPGLSLGWFQAKDGQVFAAIGAAQEVLILPTRLGYTIVATPEQAEGALSEVRHALANDMDARRQPSAHATSCPAPDQRM